MPASQSTYQIRVRYAVTFEFDTQPPLTHRGIAAGGKLPTVVKRALLAAMKEHPGTNWSSMNIVLLERLEAAETAEATSDTARGAVAPESLAQPANGEAHH
jgi:hypothetical protein